MGFNPLEDNMGFIRGSKEEKSFVDKWVKSVKSASTRRKLLKLAKTLASQGAAKVAKAGRGASPIGIAMQGMDKQFRKDFESLKKKPKPKPSKGSSTRTGAAEAKPKKKKPYTGGGRGGPKK
jgi:hypothetical protein